MAARTRNPKSSLDDKIGTLDRLAAESSPAKQVFTTASTILALVRVSVVNVHGYLRALDSMADDPTGQGEANRQPIFHTTTRILFQRVRNPEYSDQRKEHERP